MKPKKTINIVTTESFDKTVDNSITYLSQWTEEYKVIESVETALEKFEIQIIAQPYSYSRCPELMEFGVNTVRNAHIGDFRLLYEIDESEQDILVNLLLFLRTQQSVEKQLIEYCLYQ